MALWPFGKKNKDNSEATSAEEQLNDDALATESADDTDGAQVDDAHTAEDIPVARGVAENFEHDPVEGNTGPFDGDKVDIEDFDFSDFAVSILDLGSMKIPLPKDSQVQVEMGEQGPKMLHIVTRHGRITPVAFAAPSSGGQWEQSVDEIGEGMRGQGMPTVYEMGPWGREVVGTGTNGTIRILGIDGPRWMLRMTLAAPEGNDEQLATIARELAARAFVYRGDDPILAGNSLPVTLPQQLAQQVQQAVQQRAQQHNAQPGSDPAATESQMHDAMRKLMENGGETSK
ncbi:DUF3710 domain-containing protein [Corynebacterium breve]|uniref:DUF3710 domain-containing protein n=1 Tax=Corynebacterium breve TaxID=3049799 RepID=A0ABY8VLA6_9CORY|nr:DUF3710 domain-containing protein [Corynebacterium breve]WIM68974.1 DUF3710 domain-containing protein [Corynebacterium breve]